MRIRCSCQCLCCYNFVSHGFISISQKKFRFHYLNFGLQSTDEIVDKVLRSADGKTTCEDFVSHVQTWLKKIQVCYCNLYSRLLQPFKSLSPFLLCFVSLWMTVFTISKWHFLWDESKRASSIHLICAGIPQNFSCPRRYIRCEH